MLPPQGTTDEAHTCRHTHPPAPPPVGMQAQLHPDCCLPCPLFLEMRPTCLWVLYQAWILTQQQKQLQQLPRLGGFRPRFPWRRCLALGQAASSAQRREAGAQWCGHCHAQPPPRLHLSLHGPPRPLHHPQW